MHRRELVRFGRLEEQVLGGVGNVRHAVPAIGEVLQEPLGVEPRDGRDQVGAAKDPRQPGAHGRGGLEVLQHIVAGHRAAGRAGRQAVFGGAVRPVHRPRPELQGGPDANRHQRRT